MIKRWKELQFWNSGEWQVIEEKLKDAKGKWNPGPSKLFRAHSAVPFLRCRCVLAGQDPYPNRGLATGLAYSIPPQVKRIHYPPTLINLLNEYSSDLQLPFPSTGDLSAWTEQGVLLWNVIPTCESGRSLSHEWGEWEWLTKEMFEELSLKQDVCFILLGGRARQFAKYINEDCMLIEASHPSPRGNLNSKIPFAGSRIFSSANVMLVERGLEPIDWRLSDGLKEGETSC